MSAQLSLFEPRDHSQSWTVRVSRRARRLSVRVYPGGRVEVVVPPGASAAVVQRFVGTHREWINERVGDLSTAAPLANQLRPAEIQLPSIDRSYSVAYRESPDALAVHVAESDARLVVHGPLHDDRHIATVLRRWLMQLAHRELGARLAVVAAEGGFSYQRVQVRRQRTRWGSCSATGTISLNVCLLFLPPDVVRYLLVHELCHTRHMNHSARYWALVGQHEPDYERLDRELVRGWQSVPGWVFG
ncbi:MAG TPA: SprT family zinc-dependent metalloprotease [Steroidobacteraceae bacterium]|nr:SprT family zinc-dependent metalloprotease [Steroidobacteraceae bacterium]